jgi:hypothetical protein
MLAALAFGHELQVNKRGRDSRHRQAPIVRIRGGGSSLGDGWLRSGVARTLSGHGLSTESTYLTLGWCRPAQPQSQNARTVDR